MSVNLTDGSLAAALVWEYTSGIDPHTGWNYSGRKEYCRDREPQALAVEQLTSTALALLAKLDSLDGHLAPDEAAALREAAETAIHWEKRKRA